MKPNAAVGATNAYPMRRLTRGLLCLITALAGLVLVPATARAANLTDVTVRISHVVELQSADGDGSDGDFYPKVEIAGKGVQTRSPIEKRDFTPDWRITQQVDLDAGKFAIRLELWDYDSGFAGGDDHVDISPTNQDVNIDIEYDPATRTWTSPDLPAEATTATGDGDPNFPDTNDGTAARIDFDIFVGATPDFDGDGIPDNVERFGVRDANNNVVATLSSSPCRKSIAIEIDWMSGAADGHSHQPKPAAITEVVAAFAAGPVPGSPNCPFSGASTASGVELVVLPGNSVPEAAIMGLRSDFRATRDANFNSALRPYAHYAIFVHDQAAGTSSSGLCCESTQNGKDLIVSLGSWHTSCVGEGPNKKLDTAAQGDDQVVGTTVNLGADRTCDSTATGDDTQDEAVGTGADVNEVGNAREQAATIMHELGHSLGLGHGGADGINYKPNFLSNENYRFQFGIPTGPGNPSRLDYSRAALPTLNERTLKESAGIGDGTDYTAWVDPKGKVQRIIGNGAINWDQTATLDLPVDVNGDNTCVTAGADGTLNTSTGGDDVVAGTQINEGPDGDCDTFPTAGSDDVDATILTGYDDWSNIKYRAVEASTAGASNAREHSELDIDYREKLAADQTLADYYRPDVAVSKSVDKADGEGGQSLAYTVGLHNIGPGDARDVAVTDTMPDGTVANRAVGDLDAGATATEAFSYAVPCDTTDGTVLVNSATATAKDRSGRAEQLTGNNTATASTTIHAPRLTLAKTATPTVDAGAAITYRLSYTNTGSGGASNVVVTDTLPVGVYYSTALDLGAGPRPSTVTRNANGTTTLTWQRGALAAGGSSTIEYTARPGLLFLAGQTVTNTASLTFGNATGCVFAALTAAASSTITVTPATRNPLSHGYWKTHPEQRTAELRARVQATDQRYDGADGTAPDGALSNAEAQAALVGLYVQPAALRFQLLAAYLNLADRRINAATLLDSKLTKQLGLRTVGDAVRYAQATLALPMTSATASRYDNATRVLDDIATNRSPLY